LSRPVAAQNEDGGEVRHSGVCENSEEREPEEQRKEGSDEGQLWRVRGMRRGLGKA